ncbi:MAG: hypothetical protein JWR07_3718 [Nevskia sp.]|nr:hypothetical protein [Nevskia sp.]
MTWFCISQYHRGKADPMKAIQSEAEQAFYREVVQLVASDAPDGWVISVMKIEVGEPACEVTVDHIDATGHVIWFDITGELRQLLCRACEQFRVATQSGAGANWLHASLTLSSSGVISADFWRR